MKYFMGIVMAIALMFGSQSYAACKCNPCECKKCECQTAKCSPDCDCEKTQKSPYKSVERKWPLGRMSRTVGPNGKNFSIHILRIPIYRKSVTFGDAQPLPIKPENK